MNFFQLFTTFLSLHKNPQQNPEFQSNNHIGHGRSSVNQDLHANLLKFPVHQEHFDPFMKHENHFDIGSNMATTPPVLATPINNEFLKSIPFFNENIFGNNNRNGFDDRRGQRMNANSNNALNGRRDDQRRRNAGIIHRFQETNLVPTEIPAAGISASDPAFSGITPVNIDAILAGIHVAKHVPVRCDVKCGDSLHCPFGYLQEFCPRCRCAPDPCLVNRCFALDTCVAIPNQNCIDENFEMCPFESRCERIGCNCPAVWQPVCGTDNDLYSKTYVNYCAMTCVSGVTKIYDGECWPSHISRYFFATTSRPNRRSRTSATSVTMVTSPIRNERTRITDISLRTSSTLEPVINRTSINTGTSVISMTTVSRTTPSPSNVKGTTTATSPTQKSIAGDQSIVTEVKNNREKSTAANKIKNAMMDSNINTLAESNKKPTHMKDTREKLSPAKSSKVEAGTAFSVLKEAAKNLVTKQVNDQLKAKTPKEVSHDKKTGLGSDVITKQPKDITQQDMFGFDAFSMNAELSSFDKMLNDLMKKKKQGGTTPM